MLVQVFEGFTVQPLRDAASTAEPVSEVTRVSYTVHDSHGVGLVMCEIQRGVFQLVTGDVETI